jgi:hypothetical protein
MINDALKYEDEDEDDCYCFQFGCIDTPHCKDWINLKTLGREMCGLTCESPSSEIVRTFRCAYRLVVPWPLHEHAGLCVMHFWCSFLP